MVETGTLLPGAYNYPSVCYWLELVGLVPELPGALEGGITDATGARLKAAAGSQRYLLRLRALPRRARRLSPRLRSVGRPAAGT